jgi:hypothetical protein
MLKSCANTVVSVAKLSTLRQRAKTWVRRLVSVAEVGVRLFADVITAGCEGRKKGGYALR